MFPSIHGVVSQGGKGAGVVPGPPPGPGPVPGPDEDPTPNPLDPFAWTEALAPVAFWLADNVTAADGDPVGTVPDAGSLGLALTATSTARPTFSAAGGPNGRAKLGFNGTSNYLTGGTTASWKFLHDGTPWTAFIVYKTADAESNALHTLIDTNGISGANVGAAIYQDDRDSVPRDNRLITLVARAANNAPAYYAETRDDGMKGGEWQIAVVRVDKVFDHHHEGGVSIFRDGLWRQQLDSDTTNQNPGGTPSSANSTYALHVGRRASASSLFLKGDLAAIILFDAALDAEDTHRVLLELGAYYDLPVRYPLRAADLADASGYDAFGWADRHADKNLRAYASRTTTHGGGDGDIHRFVSADKGESWTDALLVDHGSGDGFRNMAGGVVQSTGTVLLFHAVYDGTDFTDMRVRRSVDHGVTFTDMGSLSSFATLARFTPYGPLVELPSGKLLQSFYEHNGAGRWKVFTLASEDDGATWGDRVTINDSLTSGVKGSETAIIYVSGASDATAKLLCVTRQPTDSSPSDTYLRQYSSGDGGTTWADEGNITVSGNNRNVSPWLKLVDGDAVLVYANRTTEQLMITRVDAATVLEDPSQWPTPEVAYVAVEGGLNGEDFGYPSILTLDGQDKNLAAVFYDGRGTNDTNLVIVPLPTD